MYFIFNVMKISENEEKRAKSQLSQKSAGDSKI